MGSRKQFYFDVFVTALEGSIGYWACATVYHWTRDKGATEDLAGFYAKVVDAEFEDAFPETMIDAKVIRKGIKAILCDDFRIGKELKADIERADINNDASYIDADSADCIVQAGMFGEIVFG